MTLDKLARSPAVRNSGPGLAVDLNAPSRSGVAGLPIRLAEGSGVPHTCAARIVTVPTTGRSWADFQKPKRCSPLGKSRASTRVAL